MASRVVQKVETVQRPTRAFRVVSGLAPLVALALLAAALATTDPATLFNNGAPPVEDLAFERVVLNGNGIEAHVRNGGPDPLVIAQVLVDDAFWSHEVRPDRTIPSLGKAVLTIPYPWVEGEPHEIAVVTATGATFGHEIPVAVASPALADFLVPGLAIGLLVGVLPIAAGMLWWPALRAGGPRLTAFVLAFTVGLLVFLGVDALAESMEAAEAAPAAFGGVPLVFTAVVASVLLVLLVDRWARARSGGDATPALTLGYLIALAIGFHNLGEGLAIGGAYAAGEAALGAALFLGFALHNVTEGPAIVAPLTGTPPRRPWMHAAGLVALAGLPTVLGAWVGGLAGSPAATAAALGLGAGAAFVVVLQVWPLLRRATGGALSSVALAGLGAGVLVMYLTGLLA